MYIFKNAIPRTLAFCLIASFLLGGCDDLWKNKLIVNPKNCAIAPAVCDYSEECDYNTERCLPLPPPTCPQISFESISPLRGSRVGGEKISITGSHFQGNMRVEIDGTPLENVSVAASNLLTGTVGASSYSCGPSPVTLISTCFERVSRESAFYYTLDPLEYDPKPITLPAPPGTQALQILSDDLNEDGDPDIVGIESGTVRVYLSDGTGSFSTAPGNALGGSLFQATFGDGNADKHRDLFVTDQANARLWALWNSGNGAFTAQSLSMPESLRGVVSADVSGDGIDDVLAVGVSGNLYFLPGSATGLGSAEVFATSLPANSQQAVLGDTNKDKQPDLIVAGGNAQTVEVWQKTATKTFTRLSQTPTATPTNFLAVGDA